MSRAAEQVMYVEVGLSQRRERSFDQNQDEDGRGVETGRPTDNNGFRRPSDSTCESMCVRLLRPQTSSKDPAALLFYSLPSDPGIRVRRSFMSGKREGTPKSALCPYVALSLSHTRRGRGPPPPASAAAQQESAYLPPVAPSLREKLLSSTTSFSFPSEGES